ncbi:MAG: type II secretion system GspH family protein [Comamonadaceae bacterium]|nr:type II secretion system GspH family protein [Comamonadaceae bacterium]
MSAFTEGLPDPEKTRVRAYRVSVEVFWPGLWQTRSVVLETLRLAPVEPAGWAPPTMAQSPGTNLRQTGFTLLELVVAITLMGLVLVVLYSGLRLGLNGWDSGEQRAEATNRLRLVQEFLRRQLAQSMTVYQTSDKQERAVVFSGQAEQHRVRGTDVDPTGTGRVVPGADRGRRRSIAATLAAVSAR